MCADLYANLTHIYANIFIDCVSRNPLYRLKPDEPINCPLFNTKLDEYVFAQAFSR
jgi:Sybindin-like family